MNHRPGGPGPLRSQFSEIFGIITIWWGTHAPNCPSTAAASLALSGYRLMYRACQHMNNICGKTGPHRQQITEIFGIIQKIATYAANWLSSATMSVALFWWHTMPRIVSTQGTDWMKQAHTDSRSQKYQVLCKFSFGRKARQDSHPSCFPYKHLSLCWVRLFVLSVSLL